ncbi:MAG: M48 family metallopeptidase [Ignavibacteriaceae bacterium]
MIDSIIIAIFTGMDSKRFNNLKIGLCVLEGVLTFAISLVFVISGLSLKLAESIGTSVSGLYGIFIIYVLLAGFGLGILLFPLGYYKDFYLEHKYNLSNQTFFKWIFEDIKGLGVSLLIGIPILLAFYYTMLKFGNLWWLPFAILLFIVSVILARVVPVFILPLFYKITPIDNEELKSRITILAEEAGINVTDVYKFDMSKNTKKANAAFTGLGKSKRILLGDTLLENYTNDEIETVIAHELGHYKKKHIVKNIIIGTVSSFLTLFIIANLYYLSLGWFGFQNITEIAALPILTLWAMLIGLVQSPLTNIISRKFEYQADEYAILSTGKAEAFKATLEKLTDQNLGDKDPHPFIEWFFYSHPSIKNRIAAIDNFLSSDNTIKNNLKFEAN